MELCAQLVEVWGDSLFSEDVGRTSGCAVGNVVVCSRACAAAYVLFPLEQPLAGRCSVGRARPASVSDRCPATLGGFVFGGNGVLTMMQGLDLAMNRQLIFTLQAMPFAYGALYCALMVISVWGIPAKN